MNAGKSSCGGVERYYSVLFDKGCGVSFVFVSFCGLLELLKVASAEAHSLV